MKANGIYITVLSPAYNKEKTIRRSFQSLLKQKCFDFEWLIVNDGSLDNTLDIAKSFNTVLFPIRIINKQNEGLNRTFNRGVKEARGQYILRLDPDDYLTEDAIVCVSNFLKMIKDNDEDICGCAFLTKYDTGNIVGTHPFDNIFKTNFFDYRYKYRAKGDRCEVVKKSVLERFPMPEIEGEKFCRESYMWNCIAQHYSAYYIPRVIYVREYGDSSISANSVRVYSKNPNGMMLCNSQNVSLLLKRNDEKFHLLDIMRSGINYYRFGLYSRKHFLEIFRGLPILVSLASFLPGLLFYIIDKCNPLFINRLIKNGGGRK